MRTKFLTQKSKWFRSQGQTRFGARIHHFAAEAERIGQTRDSGSHQTARAFRATYAASQADVDTARNSAAAPHVTWLKIDRKLPTSTRVMARIAGGTNACCASPITGIATKGTLPPGSDWPIE